MTNRLNIGPKKRRSAVDEIQTSNLAQAEELEREEAEEWSREKKADLFCLVTNSRGNHPILRDEGTDLSQNGYQTPNRHSGPSTGHL